MLINPQLSLDNPNNLTSTVQHLRNNLQALKPNNSEMTQLITYTLLATALVGIMVYHYIKQQEDLS
jgi:hypothetical protein